MTATAFQIVFFWALATSVLLRFWLKLRHINHVRRHRNQVPAAFIGSLPLAAHRKAAAYTLAKSQLALVAVLVEAALLLAWTVGGGLQFLQTGVQEALGNGLAAGVALIVVFSVLGSLLELPLSLYGVFVLEARFGFNRMSWRLWLSDLLKSTLLGAAIGLPLLTLMLWLMAAAGALWWLWAWCAWAGFSLLLLAIYPIWIAPLFNRFTPLDNPELKSRIEALLARCGFTSNGLFVMDGSKRSSHGNAYFTGFGRNKRIVFFDTLLNTLDGAEVEAVLAHELGHFKHKHVLQRLLWTFALALGGLALLGWLMQQPWFFQGLGVAQGSTAVALLLFMLAAPVFTFPLAPLSSWLSRRHEYQADAYAARQADAGALVSGLVKLYRDNAATLTPDPWHSLFYDSHPPASLRVAALQGGANPRTLSATGATQ